MATKTKAPAGAYIQLLDGVFPLTIIREREVEVRHGKKLVDTIVEPLDKPRAALHHPKTGAKNIRNLPGSILGADGTADPATLGVTGALIDGVVIPLTFVSGLTGKEGKTNQDGSLTARNPKLDLGEGVSVTFEGNPYTLRVGVSQTAPGLLNVWGDLYPKTAKKAKAAPDPASLLGVADLSCNVTFDVVAA